MARQNVIIIARMNIYILKKAKYRKYESEDIISNLAETEGADWGNISHNESGMPVLSCGLFISISDTKNYWCCAVDEKPVGVDLEEPRKVKVSLASRLHNREQKYLAGLEAESSEWNREILSIWTRKESYMKFCGEGLRLGLNKFSVIDDVLEYALEIKAENYDSAYVYELNLPQGITGSVCSSDLCGDINIKWFKYAGKTYKTALEKATDLLAQRVYGREELLRKLISLGYEDPDAEYAVLQLQERGYLNDSEYALAYIRHALNQNKGLQRIKRELKLKGISSNNIEEAIAQFEETEPIDERAMALEIASKMPHETDKEKARLARKLASLGYSASVIYDVIK